MEDAIIEKAIDLVFEPGGFKDLKNLSDNILAYSKLDFFLGCYVGSFKDFGNLCNEVKDLKGALELKEEMVKSLTKNSTKELRPSLKKHVDCMFIVLVHNINKKNNKYGINIK